MPRPKTKKLDDLFCPGCGTTVDDEEPFCHHCGYPDDEPHGAGADPYGRPDPLEHPEYWME